MKGANIRKTCRIMRLIALFLVIGIGISYAGNSYSQVTTLSLKLTNKTVHEVFDEIERSSEYIFLYNSNTLDANRLVTISVEKETISEVLDKLFAGTDNTYKVSDRQVYISKAPGQEARVDEVRQQQQIQVTGKVTDITGESLPGVTITVEGSTRGVITDHDGIYSINVAPTGNLIFSFVGMQTLTVPVEGMSQLDVVLHEHAELLDEVQIVGFGQQRKGSVTSAVASVAGQELRAPVGKLSNAFAGQIAGLISIQRTGEPGADAAEFWIRGMSSFAGGTSPLVLVDGVPRSMNDIEADEIETFTVLKDAAATAVYGAQGANGVVLITSKRGKAQRARISYRGEVSHLTPTRRPRYANSYDYLSLYNEAFRNEGREPEFSDEVLEMYRTGADPDLYPSVDWWSTLINDHTYNTRHTLNFRGGTDRARYFVSGAYYSESGYFKSNPEYDNNSTLNRYNLRSNIDIDITDNTLMRVDFSGQYLTQNRSRQTSQDIFNRISRIPPYLIPAVYSDGTFAQHPSFTNNRQNPWVYLTETGYQKTYRSFIQSSVHLEQKLDFITPGLKARGMVSYDSDNNYFTSRTKNPDTFYATGRDEEGNLTYRQIQNEVKFADPASSNNSTKKIYMEAAVDYQRDFGPHAVTGLLLANRQHRQLHNQALAYRKESFVGRTTYNYDNRYTVEFNFGVTGSEQFAKGNRYGFFPAVGLAWNVSNEPYFPAALEKIVSNFRFRASLGRTGNDETGGARFLYMPTFGDTGSYAWGIGSTGTTNSLAGLVENRFESPGISWEIEEKRNIGIDLGLWNNRVDISFDYFNDERSNILLQRRTVLNVAGFRQNPWQNYGIVQNRGFDGNINLSHIIGDFTLSGKATVTFARNKIIEYDELPPAYDWMKRTGKRLVNQASGQPLPLIAERLFTEDDFNISYDNAGSKQYALKDGIVGSPWIPQTKPGDIKYMDINGDGIIDNNDRVYDPEGYHPQIPETVYGFGFGLDYKGLYFNAFFQGAANVTVNLNSNSASFMPFHWGLIESNVRQEIVDDRWTEENPNPNAFFPRLHVSNMGNNNTQSTFWYRNGNFLRFKNLEVGYNFNKNIVNKLGISASRIYVMGHNIHVWDQVKMFDPEIGNADGGTRYPLSRTWTMGLEITF
ncbi:TonB-linked outer membrane protein, SusC/RagA family [Porphyromonadaceae bacterium NLAE-zl-C104]|nr:TonB-linked outer membrane protein, SusC/RagA family [Porphyromonadaceae bacterium NLAE-zl-C104]